MKQAELLTQVRRAEKQLNLEVNEAMTECEERIADARMNNRRKAKEVLAENPTDKLVRERIEQLQLRIELLRNIRLNWKNFEKHADERNIELRINQFSALKNLISFLENGYGENGPQEVESARAMMAFEVQPTGAGKTGAFAIETVLLDVPTLILVPFDNLVEQTKEDLIKIGGISDGEIGLVYGDQKEFGRRITVATYAGHAAQMRKKKGEYASHVQNKVKFCICDEVHTSLGERTQESIEAMDGLGNGISVSEKAALDAERQVIDDIEKQLSVKSLKIGYTATPQLSEKHVEEFFPHFLGRVYHSDMVEAGILVPYRIVQCNGSVSEGEIGTYITQELEVEILSREKIYKKLLGKYAESLQTYEKMKKKNAYPLRGMAFCTNHAECEKFAKEAQSLGLRCEIVTGKEAKGRMGRTVIQSAKEKLCSGDIDLIVTVEKLCAGFNFPEVNSIIWARITSMAKTIQGIGRGGRSHKEGRLKKECCWVFETNWTLKNNAKRGRTPLRIADALAQNGENPNAICSMADGTKLEYSTALPRCNDSGWWMSEENIKYGVANAWAEQLGISYSTVWGNLKKQTGIRGICPDGKEVNLYSEEVVSMVLSKYLEDVHQADGKGFFIDENGTRYGSLSAWHKELGISRSELRERLSEIKGESARNSQNRIITNGFYPEATVLTCCGDLANKSIHKADEFGFITKKDGNYATIDRWAIILDLAPNTIQRRIGNKKGITGKDSHGKVIENGFYQEKFIREICSELTDETLPQATKSGFFEKSGNRYGTIRAWSIATGVDSNTIRIKLGDNAGIKGKTINGRIRDFYKESEILKACQNLRPNKRRKPNE